MIFLVSEQLFLQIILNSVRGCFDSIRLASCFKNDIFSPVVVVSLPSYRVFPYDSLHKYSITSTRIETVA